MYSFILTEQPKTFNSWDNKKKQTYRPSVETSFKRFNPDFNRILEKNTDLYGIVCYFFKKDVGTDADNISKPLWDCLENVLFEDDHQIKLRIAACFPISKGINVLDFSNLTGEILGELLEAIDNYDHVVYVECGFLDNSMFKFGLENGN